MLITLNLALPEQRPASRAETWQVISYPMAILAVLVVLATASLLLVNFGLNGLTTTANLLATLTEQPELEARVRGINRSLKVFQRIDELSVPLTPALGDILNAIPQGIVLSSMAWQRGSQQLVLTGVAPLRNDLIGLEDTLASLEGVASVDLPFSSLLERTDVDFTLTIFLKDLTMKE